MFHAVVVNGKEDDFDGLNGHLLDDDDVVTIMQPFSPLAIYYPFKIHVTKPYKSRVKGPLNIPVTVLPSKH